MVTSAVGVSVVVVTSAVSGDVSCGKVRGWIGVGLRVGLRVVVRVRGKVRGWV